MYPGIGSVYAAAGKVKLESDIQSVMFDILGVRSSQLFVVD